MTLTTAQEAVRWNRDMRGSRVFRPKMLAGTAIGRVFIVFIALSNQSATELPVPSGPRPASLNSRGMLNPLVGR